MPFIYYQRKLDPNQTIRNHKASIATRFSSKVRTQQKKREILSDALYFFLGNGTIEELATNPDKNVVFKVRGQTIEVAPSTGLFNTKGATLEQLIKFVCLTHQITPPDFLKSVDLTPKMNSYLRERVRIGNKQKRKSLPIISLAEHMQQTYAKHAEEQRLKSIFVGEQSTSVLQKLSLSKPSLFESSNDQRDADLVKALKLAEIQAEAARREAASHSKNKAFLKYFREYRKRRSSSKTDYLAESSTSTTMSPYLSSKETSVGSRGKGVGRRRPTDESSIDSRRRGSKDSNPSRPGSPTVG